MTENGEIKRKFLRFYKRHFQWDLFKKLFIVPVCIEVVYRSLVCRILDPAFAHTSFFTFFSAALFSLSHFASYYRLRQKHGHHFALTTAGNPRPTQPSRPPTTSSSDSTSPTSSPASAHSSPPSSSRSTPTSSATPSTSKYSRATSRTSGSRVTQQLSRVRPLLPGWRHRLPQLLPPHLMPIQTD